MNFNIPYIPMEDLLHGRVYILKARNIKFGIYSKTHNSFYGLRTKFNSTFVDDENHWDCKEFATAKPIKVTEYDYPYQVDDYRTNEETLVNYKRMHEYLDKINNLLFNKEEINNEE